MAKIEDTTTASTDAVEVAEEITEDAVEEATKSSSVTDVVAVITGLNNAEAGYYTSVSSDDFASRKAIAKALTGSEPIDEHLGETLKLVDIIVLPVELANDKGEVNTAPRVILIVEDGTAYHATSVGLLSAIRNLFAALGQPSDWPEPLDVKVVQQKGNNGFKFFTINLV